MNLEQIIMVLCGWLAPNPKLPHGFSLREILWAYTFPDKGYDGYYNQPGTEKYVLKRWRVQRGKNMEHHTMLIILIQII